MKSDVYTLKRNFEDFRAVPEEAERVARYAGLDGKKTLRLRLLAEELVTMLPQLLEIGEGEFWIEENHDGVFSLHLKIVPVDILDVDEDRVFSVSTTGRNAAAVGIINKICIAVQFMINSQARAAREMPYDFYEMGMNPEYSQYSMWSLMSYRDYVENAKEEKDLAEEWDELEKSIIANLADDVSVGMINDVIEITVKKKF